MSNINYFGDIHNSSKYYVQQCFLSRKSFGEDKLLNEAEILATGDKLIIVGSAGIGKTTFCDHLYLSKLNEFKLGSSTMFPLLYNSKFFSNGEFPIDSLECEIARRKSARKNAASYLVIVDGLDESNCFDGINNLISFLDGQVQYKLILTTRPIIHPFDNFKVFEIQQFNQADVDKYVRLKMGENADRVLSMLSALEEHQQFFNPLLLNLIVEVLNNRAEIPNSIFKIYENFIETVLSSWDAIKGIGSRSHNSLGQNIDVLATIAVFINSKERSYFTYDELVDLVPYNIDDVLEYFIQRNLLAVDDENHFRFSHKSVFEFFVAQYFILHEKAEIQYRVGFSELVFKFIDDSSKPNALLTYLRSIENCDNLAMTFLADFISKRFKLSEPIEEVFHSINSNSHLGRWEILLAESDLSKKGKLFEEFMESVFAAGFNIVERNYLTNAGEFDLIIENRFQGLFWLEYNSDYFVECKNWSEKVGLKEVQAFCQKVADMKCKLAFFISLSGFTSDAKNAFQMISIKPQSPMLIPISKKEIESFLNSSDTSFEEFLKGQIRRTKYLKKY